MATKRPPKKRGLNDREKRFRVQCLAEFHTPSEAAKAFSAEYGREVDPRSVEHYDPTKLHGASLAKHLKDVFKAHRADYVKNSAKHVPLANKTVRLRELSDTARKFKLQGNHVGYTRVLEQIAKEVGGSSTNQRQLTGKDGGAIKTEERVIHEMPQEQVTAELRALGYDPNPDEPAETPTIQ